MDDNKQPNILVVDDTPDNLLLMSDILSDFYQVKVANNGEKAVRIARSDQAPDLILLDIMMPGMNGYEVCQILKADSATQNIPVIFLTAKTDVEDEQHGLSLGAVDYIAKPVNPAILMARIKNHLHLKAMSDFFRDKNIYLEQEVERRTNEKMKAEEQLRQSQKMEVVGQLTGGIAHDFNNILSVILGYGNLLLVDSQLNTTQQEQLKEIIAASERAVQLTKGLLTFSRKQVMEPAVIDLNTIIEHVQKFLQRVLGEDIQLSLSAGKIALPIYVDSGQIEQVLINLAANARDAMPKGGVLAIETGIADFSTFQDPVPDWCEAGLYAWIAVTDTGIGMDDETRHRIFEPFFTTKEAGKGTGLGMAIVQSIIREHNGFISVDSRVGHGTCFRIFLPVDKARHSLLQENAAPVAPMGGSETILLAEDDAAVRGLMVTILEKYGYSVIQAVDGEDAIAKFIMHHDHIRLILMDMVMPKKNGKEVSEVIYRYKQDVKIIYLSGYTSEFIKDRGIEEEKVTMLVKPVKPQELLHRMHELLYGSHGNSHNVVYK